MTEKPRIAITGKLKLYNRQTAAELITAAGGFYSPIVTKKTDILVVGKLRKTSKKLKNAEKYKIRTITEQEFYSWIVQPYFDV